jgi:hypothetical protein
MAGWTLADISWDRFDPARVDPDLLRLVKAASLVEQNGRDYARYLCGVFNGDQQFRELALAWGEEEVQHGQALGRWAMLADPGFDHAASVARFTSGFRVELEPGASVRGSRASELMARCVVETGTSAYYSALAEATDEPVLKQICTRIAADELRHYKLFYTHMKRYVALERLGRWRRLRIAWARISEIGDDELAYAYYAANETDLPYERIRYSRAYGDRAYAVYHRHHINRGIAMVFKAAGLQPQGRLSLWAAHLAWWMIRRLAARGMAAA